MTENTVKPANDKLRDPVDLTEVVFLREERDRLKDWDTSKLDDSQRKQADAYVEYVTKRLAELEGTP